MQGRHKTQLTEKIRKRQAKVGVMGLGYIGLPLALEFAKRGFSVTGIDTDANRVRQIQEGKSYSPDVNGAELKRLVRSGRFKATDGFELLEDLDCISICVPTPLIEEETPDISYIIQAIREVCKRRKKGQLITLESTTSPGTTEEVVLPILSEGGYKVGRDFFLAFSPERLDPGNVKYHTHEIPRVIGGVTTACGELAGLLYRQIVENVTIVSSPRTAEMIKLLENAFRNVNIAFVNELAQLCFRLGVDIWEVIEGAKTKPFGFMPFYPGPGVGGICIPLAPRYIIWRAHKEGLRLPLLEQSCKVNVFMPLYVVERVRKLLTDSGRTLSGSKILLLGMAYKKDVADTRKSPALGILRHLRQQGAEVSFSDPYVPKILNHGEVLESRSLSPALLKGMDCTIIVTDHSNVDYRQVIRHSRLVLDTKNVLKGLAGPNIFRL
ncbi:MAG TPA: nucleotide sugar dehydrogenase [Candidatus Tripitaka californicus]|uniref:nucleotide sugar dehydrogenase n=3 Tax=Candidatus Tripitaka californicus TaxID=3367616 RepID=UPI0040265EF3